ncbi:YciI family protein [Undibacterium sp. Di24W]|uniref:YciI family protein n=1 Tax=Undibacterium sp. Di24W TaxID=3413033 RepID=UPI003BF0AD37
MSNQRISLVICTICLSLLNFANIKPAWSQQGAKTDNSMVYAKGNKQRINAFIVLLRLRHDLFLRWKDSGKWPDDKEANAALAAHGEYWAKQLGEGKAVLAGGMEGDYWDNAAVIIFEAESLEQAQQIAKADPAVKSYVFQAQVRPFGVSFITNKYGKKE